MDARHECEQIVPVPDRQRQIGDLRLGNHRAERRVAGAEQRRRLRNRHGFGERTDRQFDVEPGPLPHFQRDGLRALLESAQFDFEPVPSGNQVADLVITGGVGLLARFEIRRQVRDGHGCAWHDPAVGVLDNPAHGGAVDLRVRGRGGEQQQSAERERAVELQCHRYPPAKRVIRWAILVGDCKRD